MRKQEGAAVASPANLYKVWLSLRVLCKGRRRKQMLWRYFTVLAVASLVIGTDTAPSAAQEVPRVVATIKPIHSIAAAILGEAGSAELLIDGAASPHSYALKPSDARMLDSADIFVRVSEQVEPFTSRIVRALPSEVEVVTLAETNGLRLLPVRYGDHFDAHDHTHEHHDGDARHADHGTLSASTADGHVWLDPENAKLMARHLAEVFSARWPEQAKVFGANAERFAAQVDAAAAEISLELAPVRNVPFVVFHDAYHYFENRFGLTTAGALTVNPDVPPGARRLSALRKKIENLGGVCVFAEPQFNARVLDAVAVGTGARSGVLDPIGVDISAGPDQYMAMLRQLADGFVSCLGHQGNRAGAE